MSCQNDGKELDTLSEDVDKLESTTTIVTGNTLKDEESQDFSAELDKSQTSTIRQTASNIDTISHEEGIEKGEESVTPGVCTEFQKPYGYEELPEWLRSNEFVRHGYRHQIKSVIACFKTIFSRHNETGNIWTHLIGTVMFSVYMSGFVYQYLGVLPFLDYLAIMFFFVGAILCFALSTLYHTLMCHSQELVSAFSRLDYIGINMLITGSHIPWIYYSFYCRKRLRNTYVASLLLSSVIIALCSFYERFGEADSRVIRSGIFGSFAFFSVIPIVHLVYLDGLQLAYNQAALGWLMAMFAFYLIGASLYTSRFPERFRPGSFDIFFQSHQLMHVCTVIGSYLHMQVIHKLMTYRLEIGPCSYD